MLLIQHTLRRVIRSELDIVWDATSTVIWYKIQLKHKNIQFNKKQHKHKIQRPFLSLQENRSWVAGLRESGDKKDNNEETQSTCTAYRRHTVKKQQIQGWLPALRMIHATPCKFLVQQKVLLHTGNCEEIIENAAKCSRWCMQLRDASSWFFQDSKKTKK